MHRNLVPDFISVDYNIPIINGFQLLQEIKKIDEPLKNTFFIPRISFNSLKENNN